MERVKGIISSNAVVVFSKRSSQYCVEVKKLLSELGASYKVIELDSVGDGSQIAEALAELTGQKTVPNVYIGGSHIGTWDKTKELYHGGQLIYLLKNAGAVKATSGGGGVRTEPGFQRTCNYYNLYPPNKKQRGRGGSGGEMMMMMMMLMIFYYFFLRR